MALTTGPDGVIAGSILLQGATHAVEWQGGSNYAVYQVQPLQCGAMSAQRLYILSG